MSAYRIMLAVRVLIIANLTSLGASVAAQQLALWASVPSEDGIVEVFSDGPPLLAVVFDENPASVLEGPILYDVHVTGEPLDEPAARSVMHDLLDAIHFLHLWNYNALGHETAYLTPYTKIRGDGNDTWTAHYPFTVAREDGAETNQSRALLDEVPGKAPGLDNQRVRRILWRDVLLDTAMLGTLREALDGQSIPGFVTSGDPRLATSERAATAFEHLRDTTDALANITEAPGRLSDLVTLARNAGVPAQTLQNAIDASVLPEGLSADIPYQGAGSFRSDSPFDELLTHAEHVGLGLDILSLAGQVTNDAFDGIAMQLAANAAADSRLRFLEDLLTDDCTTMSNDVDAALCGGLALAREEFDALSEGLYTGIAHAIAQSMTDTDSLLSYAGVTASITGHIATLAGAGVLSTTATVAGAGVLVFRSLSSIAGEFQLVRRAFLLAHLNHLLQQRAQQLGGPHPSDTTDVQAWQTARLHATIALTIEWMYFHTLYEGYSASRFSPSGLFHDLTQWIHGSASVVDDLDEHRTTALDRFTTFQPLSSVVTIQTASTGRSDQQNRASAGTASGRIVYTSGAPGGHDLDLFTIEADGSDARPLLDTPGMIGRAFWNGAGTRLLVADRLPDGRTDHRLVTFDADGSITSDTSLLLDGARSGSGAGSGSFGWHPNEDSFLYHKAGSRCGGYSVLRRFLDGTEEVFLDPAIVGDGIVYSIDFHPSGEEVIWTSQVGCWSPTLAIHRAQLAGGSIDASSIDVVVDDGQYVAPARYSPDGTTIAYRRSDASSGYSGPENLYVMNGDGSDVRKLTDNSTSDERLLHFAWSPEGDQLVYSASENWATDQNTDLFVVPVSGGTTRRLTTSEDGEMVLDWR